MRSPRVILIPILILTLPLFLACSNDEGRNEVLTIYAASSLTEAFGELERRFEAEHPNIDVRLVFAGSQTLRLQIQHGAEADLFATADPSHVDALADAGLMERSVGFATNALVVAVPEGNPADIRSFGDLDRARSIVLGTEHVPVGAYAREAIESANAVYGEGFGRRVFDSVVSEESNTRLVVSRASMGEVDATIVYVTDALATDGVIAVPIPATIAPRAEYSIGVLVPATDASEAWLELLASDAGQGVLAAHGFAPTAQ